MNDEFTQRYFQGWQSRKCTIDGKLKPFTQAELEHIRLINDHLKQLTVEVATKAQRVSSLFLSELAKGNTDFEDYEATACIVMTYDEDDDNYDGELQRLIEYTWKQPSFIPVSLPSYMSEHEQVDAVAETLERCNKEQSGIGRLWNEMWDVHHVSLSWAFGHFFNHLSVFTMEDIMKLRPCNFTTEIKISL